MSPIKLCGQPGCPNVARPGKGRCDEHMKAYERDRSASRRKATNGVYKRKRWEMLRRRVLFEQPLCPCGEIAVDVDHIVPLSQGGAPYARSNTQGLCPACHHTKTASENAGA